MNNNQDLKHPFPNPQSPFIRAACGFALAMNMLTTLPFFRVHYFLRGNPQRTVFFSPLVGALLGGLLYLSYLLLVPYFPEPHLKIFLLLLWMVLTGALHLDGFADTVDGLFVSKERAEAVMKDPHVGGMGMLFSTMFLLFKASALWFLEALYLLPVIMMLSRYNAVLAIYFFPYIRKEGMGALAKEEFVSRQLLFSTIIVFTVILFAPQGWILLAFSLTTLLLIKRFFIRRFGGFSGDVYGFLIEATELVLLNILLIGVIA